MSGEEVDGERLLSESWALLETSLRSAQRLVESCGDQVDRLEGHRMILRLLAAGVEASIDFADPLHPEFFEGIRPTRKIFVDCPDALYWASAIDPSREYRVSGDRGDAGYLGLLVLRETGTDRFVAGLNDTEIEFAPDGSFEVLLSSSPGPGPNRLLLEPGSTVVAARQYRHHHSEAPVSLRIDLLGEDPGPRQLDALTMARAIRRIALLVAGVPTVSLHQPFSPAVNTFEPLADDTRQRFMGTPDNSYHACRYELRGDEALVVQIEPPEGARYWGIHLASVWSESFEYRDRQVSLNDRQVAYRSDGTVRVVVAHTDPGVPNWLDTAGHLTGLVTVRALLARHHPLPTARVVPHSDLA